MTTEPTDYKSVSLAWESEHPKALAPNQMPETYIDSEVGLYVRLKRFPKRPPTDCRHVHAQLEALKIVERVAGIEPA